MAFWSPCRGGGNARSGRNARSERSWGKEIDQHQRNIEEEEEEDDEDNEEEEKKKKGGAVLVNAKKMCVRPCGIKEQARLFSDVREMLATESPDTSPTHFWLPRAAAQS